MSPAGARRWLAVLFLLALFLRLGAIFALKRWDDAAPGAYRQPAASLVEFGAFYFRDWTHFGPTSIVTPPYPILLASLFALFGAQTPTAYFAALALNAIFGASCAVATAALVRRMIGRDGPALIAAALVALWPPQIMAAIYAQPMALTALVLVTACVMWRRLAQRGDPLSCIGFAIAAALGVLLEPAMAPALLVAIAAMLFARGRETDLRVRNAAVTVAIVALFVWPWVARNRAVHTQWLMTTSTWQRVWAGANDNATGSDRLPLTPERRAAAPALIAPDDGTSDTVRIPMMQIDLLSPSQRYALRARSEVAREAQFRSWAIEYAQAHRERWLGQVPVRLLKAWVIDWDHPLSRHPAAMVPRILLAIAAIWGAVMVLNHRAGWGAPVVVSLSMLLSAALSVASAKQTIAIEPIQIALAVAGLALLGRRADRAVEQPLPLTQTA